MEKLIEIILVATKNTICILFQTHFHTHIKGIQNLSSLGQSMNASIQSVARIHSRDQKLYSIMNKPIQE